MELRTRREGAPDIPGIDSAADGAVHQVQCVRDGVEHHAGATEHAGALRDRPGQGVAVAGHINWTGSGAEHLVLTFFKDSFDWCYGSHVLLLAAYVRRAFNYCFQLIR